MEMTYGMDIKPHEDKFLQASQRAMEYFEGAMVPGAFLVDTFTICSSLDLWVWDAQLTVEPTVKNVPDWFPGVGFKRFAKAGRGLFDIAVDGPLNHVKETLKVCLPAARIHTLIARAK